MGFRSFYKVMTDESSSTDDGEQVKVGPASLKTGGDRRRPDEQTMLVVAASRCQNSRETETRHVVPLVGRL